MKTLGWIRKALLTVLLLIFAGVMLYYILLFFRSFEVDGSTRANQNVKVEVEADVLGFYESAPLEGLGDEMVDDIVPVVSEEEVLEVSFISIYGLPLKVQQGEEVAFSVLPLDENGGDLELDSFNVRFASTDTDAVLPEDLNLMETNGGFVSGVFNTPGIHTVSVFSVDDLNVFGEVSFEVMAIKQPIELLLPQPGVYADLQLVIRGEVDSGIDVVRIYDGGIVIADEVEVNDNGTFMFMTKFLTPGVHKFRAVSLTNAKHGSEVVEVSIRR